MKKLKSKMYSINWDEVKSVSRGAAIAATGAGATYLIEYFKLADFGEWNLIIGGLLAVATNLVRKFLSGK